jgi:hypothetical protein
MLLSPSINRLPVDAFVVDIEVWPRPTIVRDPVICREREVGSAHESQAQVLYAMF